MILLKVLADPVYSNANDNHSQYCLVFKKGGMFYNLALILKPERKGPLKLQCRHI